MRFPSSTLRVAVRNAARGQRERTFIARAGYNLAKKMMPKISETEQVSLGCGTVGFDREIFGGSPSLRMLLDKYEAKLSSEERAFLDNEVNVLCQMIDDHKVHARTRRRGSGRAPSQPRTPAPRPPAHPACAPQVTTEKDLPADAWDYMRDMGFFSMKIPKEWGGKGFSTHAVSTVLAKIATHCPDANATVAVPNSLGPGELLVRYGTDEQKGYFLPRLADGTLIPCFGLTGPHNGSDATALQGAFGVVEKRGDELGIRATFRKRYITLAPVAGVVGVGFDLQDPSGLLGGSGEQGFTVALLERGHEGLRMGPRHMPLNCAFMNGTVEGDDVWIPMTSVLGGQARCGFGWHMMIEALAEGRGVSLPAGSIGAARSVVAGVGAYARVRKQFKVPIAEFGGIQEALGRCGREAYAVMAGVELTNAIIDNHEAPMVLSSIMKQTCTERGRKVVQDGMDILGGAGICRGEANFLGNSWMSTPIGITVEGANIMTRSFMIIGQGVTRCHPHMLPLIASLQSDEPDAPAKFRSQFLKMVSHVFTNFGLGLVRGLAASATTAVRSSTAYKGSPEALVAYHEAQLARLSANFAFTADLALLLGGRLKYEELLMGRMADTMGAIFLGYATLHHFSKHASSVQGLNVLAEATLLQVLLLPSSHPTVTPPLPFP